MTQITVSSPIVRTPRVLQLEGLFDLPPSKASTVAWQVSLPLAEFDWNIGLIVGPSGCGKSTIARHCFGPRLVEEFAWPPDRALVDAFPAGMPIKEITGVLSSVGLSSPPAWLRPYAVLSTGQKFRATIARALAEALAANQPGRSPPEVDQPAAPFDLAADPRLVVIDEFTSVVDRTVAQIGSGAITRTVRRHGLRFVAVSCHYDVIDWLQPDWLYEPAANAFARRSVQPRPALALELVRVHPQAWALFKGHHYLSGALNPSARCFVGLVSGQPASFAAVLPFPHPRRPGWREHRIVCLPDFQGVGIGNATSELVASLFKATGKPYRSVTSHPALIAHRAKSDKWRMIRPPSRTGRHHLAGFDRTSARRRLTASFEYVGPADAAAAVAFGIVRRLLVASRRHGLGTFPPA